MAGLGDEQNSAGGRPAFGKPLLSARGVALDRRLAGL